MYFPDFFFLLGVLEIELVAVELIHRVLCIVFAGPRLTVTTLPDAAFYWLFAKREMKRRRVVQVRRQRSMSNGVDYVYSYPTCSEWPVTYHVWSKRVWRTRSSEVNRRWGTFRSKCSAPSPPHCPHWSSICDLPVTNLVQFLLAVFVVTKLLSCHLILFV